METFESVKVSEKFSGANSEQETPQFLLKVVVPFDRFFIFFIFMFIFILRIFVFLFFGVFLFCFSGYLNTLSLPAPYSNWRQNAEEEPELTFNTTPD